MKFEEVFPRLLEGYYARRKDWKGYWVWENNTIMIYCKDGEVLDIRKTKNVKFTIENMLADDWMIFL